MKQKESSSISHICNALTSGLFSSSLLSFFSLLLLHRCLAKLKNKMVCRSWTYQTMKITLQMVFKIKEKIFFASHSTNWNCGINKSRNRKKSLMHIAYNPLSFGYQIDERSKHYRSLINWNAFCVSHCASAKKKMQYKDYHYSIYSVVVAVKVICDAM